MKRITALWGFSEATIGGILHVFKIPITGLFLGSFAVIFISLIYFYSKDPNQILKSTLIVILVKFVVSPYSPITAYFAVFLQGVFGFILFYFGVLFKTAAISLGLLALLSTGVQKIIIYTLLFGFTFWKSINIFYQFILKQFFNEPGKLGYINLSYLIIGLYILLHIIVGLLAGVIASKLPDWIEKYYSELEGTLKIDISAVPKLPEKGKRIKWWKRKSSIIIFSILISVAILSYFYPEVSGNLFVEILIMVVRSSIILLLWLFVLVPVINKLFIRYAKKNKNKYSEEINNIISLFPQFKIIILESWKLSMQKRGLAKMKYFFTLIFIFLLKYKF